MPLSKADSAPAGVVESEQRSAGLRGHLDKMAGLSRVEVTLSSIEKWLIHRQNRHLRGHASCPAEEINCKHMLGKIEGGHRLKGGKRGTPPLVSIITVVFRAGQDLPALLDSVFSLKDENTELIVVDGGSEDGTLELLREHDSEIDYWVSESDSGIYDAMNKGIAEAKGTFLLHLNAGDRLLYIPVRELRATSNNQVDVAAFRVSIDGEYEFRPSFGIGLRFNNTLHHQGTFFRRESFPAYDLRYKVFADFDVNQRLAFRGVRVGIFDQVVALHSTDGISSRYSAATNSEFFRVILSNHGWSHVPIAWLLCKWRGLRSRLMRRRSPKLLKSDPV